MNVCPFERKSIQPSFNKETVFVERIESFVERRYLNVINYLGAIQNT